MPPYFGDYPLGQEPNGLQIVAIDERDEVLQPSIEKPAEVGNRILWCTSNDAFHGDLAYPGRKKPLRLLRHARRRFGDDEGIRGVRAQHRSRRPVERCAMAVQCVHTMDNGLYALHPAGVTVLAEVRRVGILRHLLECDSLAATGDEQWDAWLLHRTRTKGRRSVRSPNQQVALSARAPLRRCIV